MKKDIQKEDVKFQLKGIEILDIHVDYPKVPLQGLVTFNFNINVEIKILNETKQVVVFILVDIFDSKSENKFGSIKIGCEYGIENFDSFINVETNNADFPKQFITIINSITISTVRGVMFSQFRGTFLHGAILPIIDPTFLDKKEK